MPHTRDRWRVEFLSSQQAVNLVYANREGGATQACKALIDDVDERVEEELGPNEDYRDDITAVVAFLPLFGALQAYHMAASMHGEAPPQTQADTSVKVITRRRSSMMSTMQEHELDEKLEARARSNTEELSRSPLGQLPRSSGGRGGVEGDKEPSVVVGWHV